LPLVLDDASNDLSPAMRRLLGDLFADLCRLEQRIDHVTREIAAIADREDVASRLMTIPRIGALGATAVLAAVGYGRQFQKARDLAAFSSAALRRRLTRPTEQKGRPQAFGGIGQDGKCGRLRGFKHGRALQPVPVR
jgi:transposase